MKHCRERALLLLEVAERTASPEIGVKAATLAEMWLTLAAIVALLDPASVAHTKAIAHAAGRASLAAGSAEVQ
jgi:hypothetical protein